MQRSYIIVLGTTLFLQELLLNALQPVE